MTVSRLGERAQYIRYRVTGGEVRRELLTLGQAVHADLHEAQQRLMAALVGGVEDGYNLEDTTPGERLPAGPETKPWHEVGGKKGGRSGDYPKGRAARAIDRALGAGSRRWADWIARIGESVDTLGEYEPHGRLMADSLRLACLDGTTRLRRGQGWRHYGPRYDKALALWGSEEQYRRALADGWELVAARVVDAEVWEAARSAEAVSEAALAWQGSGRR